MFATLKKISAFAIKMYYFAWIYISRLASNTIDDLNDNVKLMTQQKI